MNILLWIVLGALAGWIAGMIMKSSNSLIESIVLGVIGAILGGFIMNVLGYTGITGFNVYSLVVAVIGAVVVVFVGRKLHK